jgi:glycine/D-amino acid oxidase-like deaminating enzyme
LEQYSSDFVIVGQGLSGSVLAYSLWKQGQSVIVLDNPSMASSSKVAGGIYNPVTGKKLTKTWMADELFPFLASFYTELEEVLRDSFFYPLPIYRPFSNVQIQDIFKQEGATDGFAGFGTVQFDGEAYRELVQYELGGVTTSHSGWLDLPKMLKAFRSFFLEKGILKEIQLNLNNVLPEQLVYEEEGLQMSFKKLIFCEGDHARHNPFFNWLPFTSVKGEVLTVKMEQDFEEIINQGVFVIPLGNRHYRVGATYSWHSLDGIPTESAKAELLTKYKKLMKPDCEVIEHLAGVRPATKDRRPFLGLHPKFSQLAIFNGMGSKGVSLAPYFAKEMADFLLSEKELNPEVNINRYVSFYTE